MPHIRYMQLDSFVERFGIKNELTQERGIKIGWKYENGDLIIILKEDKIEISDSGK